MIAVMRITRIAQRVGFILSVTLGWTAEVTLAQQTAPDAPPNSAGAAADSLIRDLFRVQFDHHLNEKLFLDHDPSAKLTVERCEEALRRLQPASVTVCALGHEGWARVSGTVLPPHPALSKDSLAIWREACDRTHTPLFIYVSSLINYKANHEHPEFARLFSNGNPADQRIDHNSAFVDEYLIPFCRELVSRYRPDGLWFDGDYWSIFPSWNPASVTAFETEFGRKAPVDFADPAFSAFWEFTTRSHARYVEKVAAAIRAIRPTCGLVINSAYTLRQPDPLPAYVARVNLDVPTYFGMEAASIEARYQGARDGRPFDIVIGGHSEPEGAPFGYAKPSVQLEQEMAAILSHGGGVSVYVGMDVDGGFEIEEVAKLRDILDGFVRPRAEVFRPSTSAAEIALLHCAADFQHTHRLERLRGAALALLRSNFAFDIVDDSQFATNPGRYKTVVLPMTEFTSPSLLHAVEQFVSNGGAAVVSLAPATALAANLGKFPAFFPFAHATMTSADGMAELPDGPLQLSGYLSLLQANVRDATSLPIAKAEGAALVHQYAVGKGRVAIIAADLPVDFDRAENPRIRKIIADQLAWATGSDVLVNAAAPPWIEVVARRIGARLVVHLVNHARGREGRPRAPAVEFVPPVDDVRVSIKCDYKPASVACFPNQAEMEWSWSANRVDVRLRNVGVHCAILIEGAAPGGK